MSVLTKVFVVLVTLLAVAVVAVTVPVVARTENWRAKYDNEQTQRQQAETAARHRTAELAALQSRLAANLAENDAELATLRAENAALDETNKALEAANADLEARQRDFEARLAQLAADGTRNQSILQGVMAELSDRREAMLELQRQSVRNLDTINQLQSNTDALTKQLRLRREQTVALQEQVAELEDLLSRVPPVILASIRGTPADQPGTDNTFVPPFEIAGEVTDVAQHEGVTLVELNVGSNDRVEQNMRFMVYRGGTYLGEVVIVSVDKNASAGKVRKAPEGAQIAVADAVLTGPAF